MSKTDEITTMQAEFPTEPLAHFEQVRTTQAGAHVGERIRIAGWVHALRRLGAVTFLVVRDGWGTLQVVFEEAEGNALPSGIGVESVVAIEGTVTEAAQAPGGIELRQPHVEVITPVDKPPPVALSKRELKANITTLLDHAVVANRHPTRRAVLRLGAGAMAGFRATLTARGFTEITTP
ncbi:MAG: OB-fold nucleic acid binding domain-containing protein, partial [Ktedonobacterales bacterium]